MCDIAFEQLQERKQVIAKQLHQAVISNDLTGILLPEPLISYRSVVMERNYETQFVKNSVPGMLKAYDLPDLVAALSPQRVWMLNVVDGRGERATDNQISSEYFFCNESL